MATARSTALVRTARRPDGPPNANPYRYHRAYAEGFLTAEEYLERITGECHG